MVIHLRSLSLDGSPLDAAVEAFAGDTAVEVLEAIKDRSPFLNELSVADFIARIVSAAAAMANVHLVVSGEDVAARAASLIAELLKHKLAVVGNEPAAQEGKPCADLQV